MKPSYTTQIVILILILILVELFDFAYAYNLLRSIQIGYRDLDTRVCLLQRTMFPGYYDCKGLILPNSATSTQNKYETD